MSNKTYKPDYKRERGDVEINGNNPTSKKLAFIDLIGHHLRQLAMVAMVGFLIWKVPYASIPAASVFALVERFFRSKDNKP